MKIEKDLELFLHIGHIERNAGMMLLLQLRQTAEKKKVKIKQNQVVRALEREAAVLSEQWHHVAGNGQTIYGGSGRWGTGR